MSRPAPPPQLSVVVPTYNDAAMLRRALDCLAHQSLEPVGYELVVVDDGSTDDTPAVIAAASRGRARVRTVRLDANRGRSAARNAGILAAQGPLVVFVDSDILVRPDFLQRHLALHRAARRPGVGRGPVALLPEAEVPIRDPLTPFTPAYLATANASVPRQTLIDVGLFDEGFRLYGWEDFDLGLRLAARGIPRLFDAKAIAFHVQPLPTVDTLDRHLAKEEERARTALYLLRKHPGSETRWLIQDTRVQRLGHALLGCGGLITPRNAPRVARWLQGRGLYAIANLLICNLLTRHYLATLDRLRMTRGRA